MKTLIKSIIKFTDHTHPITEISYMEIEDELTPQDIWENIKQSERGGHNDGFAKLGAHTVKSLKYGLTLFNKNYKYVDVKNIANDFGEYDYIVELDWEQSVMYIHAHHKGNYEQDIMCLNDRYITDTSKNEGNCIDDFIHRGVISRLDIINELVLDIQKRLPDRQIAIEYHNTGCYEKDFTQIALIKKQAEKIVENCNTQLERIADKYTKL